ncbi:MULTISPECIES: proline racemase [Peptostreptococcales]|uniref:Proline racemase n=1 Tax=Peptacetobacter hiranonis (strain DSM 13275 / JCM 10541 / KCTC 15199 / TO-931) TaxID=500633 RepID=B6FY52_PEPHT|nr:MULTISPECIES: proline racemase [Peptostreptococcaceae]EEA85599.1 proline racemase [Peptacetobacter hiranonis DSM 13275]MED9947723.1 proline racemase [Peptacetobacter hiranonis]MEE0249344.1 proline racemase [Peptacetobacter hiranonis]QEK20103.1 Proline racemase [Peptacetobacter hiranonis]RHQ97389.1 proline racemase [Peptoclostridium sp. AF21-18]
MKFSRTIQAIDSHTAGEATRIVVGGIPNIKGNTMPEKKQYLEDHLDHIRTAIMLEPRGHNDMFGSVMTQPCDPDADFGIIFMDGGGYLNMCGHGSIGAMTVAVETGVVPMEEPVTKVVMEAPAGIIKGDVKVENGKVQSVSIFNVPAFLYKKDQEVELPGVGKVKFDISFGGSFFAIVHASQLGLKIEPKNAAKLTDLAMELRDIINRDIEIQHPTLEHIKTVDLVEIWDEPTNEKATYKNVVIFGQGQVDRSPCGTGTSAKLATLHARGELKEGEKFVYESILGTLFEGEIVGTTKVGEFDAVLPKITGSAYMTGFNNFLIDEDDPVKYGFILK